MAVQRRMVMLKTADELEKELQAARQRESATAAEVAETIKREKRHDWSIEWKSGWGQHQTSSRFVFHCQRQPTQEWRDRVAWFKNEYPKQSHLLYDTDRVEGMEYVLVESKNDGWLLLQVSGGTLVLKATDSKDHFSHEPRRITDLEAQSLKNGIVPDSLKVSA
jgi:hypothetical protein